MFEQSEINCFSADYFHIMRNDSDFIEVQSKCTEQYWFVMKFNKKDFPKMVLYHKHTDKDRYHIHYCYNCDNALLSLSEIKKHDKYIIDREKGRKATYGVSMSVLIHALPR